MRQCYTGVAVCGGSLCAMSRDTLGTLLYWSAGNRYRCGGKSWGRVCSVWVSTGACVTVAVWYVLYAHGYLLSICCTFNARFFCYARKYLLLLHYCSVHGYGTQLCASSVGRATNSFGVQEWRMAHRAAPLQQALGPTGAVKVG